MGILSFAENVQVFDDLQKMLTVTENKPQICSTPSNPVKMHQISGPMNSSLLRVALGLFVALATVSMTLTLCL